ncbi:hypothetical protein SAMN05216474_0236 [Lishizhenia tianjinensis]|uniref:Uncharacterized protein n=1 Tax=Lishizhenia tianjinensis TaxID=477690 RepID=A0A1I6XIE6_9FLAO|nr:hypothetical protein [Lishizhenia tianjinensis]SFT38188.1 hypothetical protein SAMN05216474_0236 [Lishizhenia tianjinensis]
MLKSLFIGFLTLLILWVPSYLLDYQITQEIQVPIKWLLIIVGAILLERVVKYLLFYPFKFFGIHKSKNVIVKHLLNFSFSAAYISLWLAVGINPINAVVQGKVPEKIFSNADFLMSALFFTAYAFLFSLLWILFNRGKSEQA